MLTLTSKSTLAERHYLSTREASGTAERRARILGRMAPLSRADALRAFIADVEAFRLAEALDEARLAYVRSCQSLLAI